MRRRATWGYALMVLLPGANCWAEHSHSGGSAHSPGNGYLGGGAVSPGQGSGLRHHHWGGGGYSAGGGYSGGTGYSGGGYSGGLMLGLAAGPYYYGNYGLPPYFLDPGSMYGPQSPGPFTGAGNFGGGNFAGGNLGAGNFGLGNLGGGGMAGQGPAVPAPIAGQQPQGGQAPAASGDPPAKKARTTNAAAKARAGKFLQFGDQQFAKQKYYQALERYREAATIAPDLAECFFRQGFAQFAMGQFEAAAKSYRRGLQMRPDWAESEFELISLYGAEHKLAKLSHREALAQAIELNAQSADLLTVMAIVLYFDGDRPRSRLFFDRAAELGGNTDHALDGFLTPGPIDAPLPGRERGIDADKAAVRTAGKANF
jgi:Flp pilus assembly protein TadD